MPSTLEKVATVFAEVFAVRAESITEATTPDDIAKWDSLGHMSMVSGLMKAFDLQFELDEIMEMATVRQILDILEKKGA